MAAMVAIFDIGSGLKSTDFLHLTQLICILSSEMIDVAISELLLHDYIQDGCRDDQIGFWITLKTVNLLTFDLQSVHYQFRI